MTEMIPESLVEGAEKGKVLLTLAVYTRDTVLLLHPFGIQNARKWYVPRIYVSRDLIQISKRNVGRAKIRKSNNHVFLQLRSR